MARVSRGLRPPMKCIFCLEERPGSEEHVFPLAIGGVLTTWRVCKPCNDRLGSEVDSLLSNHLLVTLSRSRLGLAGNSGTVPEPVLELLKDGHLASDPDQPVRLTVAPDGKIEPRLIFRKERLVENGLEIDRITLDAREARRRLPTILARDRKRQGLPPLAPAEMEEEIDRLVETRQPISNSTIRGQVAIDLEAPVRALVKIVYELAFLWLGEAYLDDPMGEILRKVILEGADPTQAGVRGRCRAGLLDFLKPWSGEGDSHVAVATSSDQAILISLKVFNAFSIALVVSLEAGRYRAEGPRWPGRFLQIDTATGGKTMGDFRYGLARAVYCARRRHRRVALATSASPLAMTLWEGMARVTGLEPATSGVTGRRSNQLSYTRLGGRRTR
jgi:septum formation topological specificity factor MinE